MTIDLGNGYELKVNRTGLKLMYRGELIARPFCHGYALRVINQHQQR